MSPSGQSSEVAARSRHFCFAPYSRQVRFVPCVDINHHLFGAVVMILIKLIQLGGPVEVRPPTPWHWLAISLCFSYLIDD